ncbi:putative gustatory receptor 28a isoform X1 [Armigeres subalbatus]|uniref:putative gustatory receptor 28a isoform X1 n=1 Tax=Armigeres subalbatus TaxID=124917 RepID=UPI002ED281DD
MAFFKWIHELMNPKNFYAAQAPILKSTFFGGMTPFTVVNRRRHDSALQCTTFGYINSCIHALTFSTCYIITLGKQESVTAHFFDSEISTLGDILQLMVGLVALISTFGYGVFRRQTLIDAFHALARTDVHFKEIGVETDYRSTLLYNYGLLFIQLVISLTYIFVSISIVTSSGVFICATTWAAFFLPFLMMTMSISLFLCIVNQSKHRFYLLNKILRSLHEISLDKRRLSFDEKQMEVKVMRIQKPLGISSVFSNTNRYMPDVINQVANIQSEICDACDCVENYFNVQMLTIVTISFLIGVFDSYYILETIFTDNSSDTPFTKLQFIAFFLCQGVMHVVGVLKIVYVNSFTVQENKQIAVNVHKLINVNHYDEELTKQLTNLSLQLNHRKVAFTAYGFFKLDFTLLFTLVGAATTYLVILVQFSLNQSQPCDPKMISAITAHRNATKSP